MEMYPVGMVQDIVGPGMLDSWVWVEQIWTSDLNFQYNVA